jgi:hypothetical protein
VQSALGRGRAFLSFSLDASPWFFLIPLPLPFSSHLQRLEPGPFAIRWLPAKASKKRTWAGRFQIGMTFLRIVIPLYLFV